MEKRLPPQIDWVLYIERKQPLFIAAAFISPYGKMLYGASGFRFTHQLFTYKEDTCNWYHSAREMKSADIYYLNLILNHDKRIIEWVKAGKYWNQKANQFMRNFSIPRHDLKLAKCYLDVIDKFQKVILFGTVIPYRILSAIDSAKEKTNNRELQNTLKLFEPLRAETRYPQFAERVLRQFWKRATKYQKNKNIDLDLISLSTPSELGNFFQTRKGISITNLKKRKKWCMFWEHRKTNRIVFAYDKTIIKRIDISEKITKQLIEFKGNIAYKGIVRGVVRIVNQLKDAKNFHSGDIIVSINTNPSLMPILVKCSGIITDEGGIMCHAAIVSRELKIPCIVGTKIATKVLKDGDIAEVDANQGIVKIIKASER